MHANTPSRADNVHRETRDRQRSKDADLVLRKKDFMQLFGDRSNARLEPPWRCVFFGSDQFSVQVLRLLHGTGLSVVPGEGLLCTLDVCTHVSDQGTKWYGIYKCSDQVQLQLESTWDHCTGYCLVLDCLLFPKKGLVHSMTLCT